MKRHIIFLVCFFLLFLNVNAQKTTFTIHVIQAGETLYSIAHNSGTTVDKIREANPEIGEVYQAGMTIRIPVTSAAKPKCKETYIVKKKETLYGISKQFGITIDELKAANPGIEGDKVKKDTELCIPYHTEQVATTAPTVTVPVSTSVVSQPAQTTVKPTVQTTAQKEIKMAVILPFGLSHETKTKEACTMIDLYEGILLSVQEHKRKGTNIHIYSYDEEDIDNVLTLPVLKNMDMIIGPKDLTNISRMKEFCQMNRIPLVIPMSSSDEITDYNPYVFQVNSKLSRHHTDIFEEMCRKYSNDNIVFVTTDMQSNQLSTVNAMKNYFNQKGIFFKDATMQELVNDSTKLTSAKRNIIIPLSSTQNSFEALTKTLATSKIPSSNIRLVGWADWQTFATTFQRQFALYHCSFYTTFFCNPYAYESVTFSSLFRNRFGRDQYQLVPRFGTLGYDIGNFFIKHISEQGKSILDNAPSLTSNSIQNHFKFRKNGQGGGFINDYLMYVEYKADGSVSITKL